MTRICPHCERKTEALVCQSDGYRTVRAERYTDADPLLGSVFEGRYRIEQRLGMGGMSTLYRATQLAVGRPVAIKLLSPELASDLKAVARFQREARAVAALRHPNTVRLFDYGQSDDGHLFLVMEYLDGESLARLVDTQGPLHTQRVIHVAKQILDALAEAHERGIIHRDLKPDNVFVTRVGLKHDFVKILDFGIAKVAEGGRRPQGKRQLTGDGTIIGSPGYMAPEQIRSQVVTAQTDLYAVGVIMHEMLTGEPLFQGESTVDCLMAHLESPPEPPEADGEPLEGPLIDFVMSCLAAEPMYRPSSAAIALRMLTECEAQPVRGSRETAPYAAVSVTRPRPMVRVGSDTPKPVATLSTNRSSLDIPLTRHPTTVGEPEVEASQLGEVRGHRGWLFAVALVAALVAGGLWYLLQDGDSSQRPQLSTLHDAPSSRQAGEGVVQDPPPAPAETGQAGGVTPGQERPKPVEQAADKQAPPADSEDTSVERKAPEADPEEKTPASSAEAKADKPVPEARAPEGEAPEKVADAQPGEETPAEAKDGAKEPLPVEELKPAKPADAPKGVKVTLKTKPTGATAYIKREKIGVTPFEYTWVPEKGQTKSPLIIFKLEGYEFGYLRVRPKDEGKTRWVRLDPDYNY